MKWNDFRVLLASRVRQAGQWSWAIRLEYKFEDLWIGAFWKRDTFSLDVWVCVLPCLPIHIIAAKGYPHP